VLLPPDRLPSRGRVKARELMIMQVEVQLDRDEGTQTFNIRATALGGV